MTNNKEIVQEIQSLFSFQQLVETYEEIAATRMRRIRSSVLHSRDFIGELSLIFQELQNSYKHQVALLQKKNKKKKNKVSLFREDNGKTLAVLLSANTGLYGDILAKTSHLFTEYVTTHESDAIIIGRYGKTAFEGQETGKAFTYYDFPPTGFTPEDLKNLLTHMLSYSSIYIFHGKFQTIVNQEATIAAIAGQEVEKKDISGDVVKYMFEPSLEKILAFFEEEITAAFFEQAVHESELAKFASRMVTLDKATQNIKTRLKKVELAKRLISHRAINKKQQESLTGMILWGK